MGTLLVYKSSAGSGKTFTLAVEYIKLLVRNPLAYRSILAVTFTNKATVEMKERILGQLYGIAGGDPGSGAYVSRICQELDLSPQVVKERTAEALTCIIHDYSRFRVETIDAFFQTVMRNLAHELGLGAGINIELDTDKALYEAVDLMVENLDEHSPIFKHLLEYTHELIKADKSWNITPAIKKFGKKIFNEEFLVKRAELYQKLKDPHFIRSYKKKLENLKSQAIEPLQTSVGQFYALLQEFGLEPEDLKGGARGIGSYFKKLENGTYSGTSSSPVRNTTVEKHLEGADAWGTAAKCPIKLEQHMAEKLFETLKQTEDFRLQAEHVTNSCDLSLKHINDLALLTAIDKQVHELNREYNRFLLAETNILLSGLVQDEDSSFVFEKIGADIRHVMIDEFQDTSELQWKNFRMLLAEGLSTGSDSLIVGDVKQAIYRWRGGDWNILAGLKGKSSAFPIDERFLNVNHRSEEHIITFNNALFTAATGIMTGEKKETQMTDAYCDVKQKVPEWKEGGKGFVKLEFLEGADSEQYTENTHQALVEEVRNLMAHGIRISDIVILVRKNKFIPPIADYFEKHIPECPIVSDEAFCLKSSAALQLLVEAVRHLAAPSDRIPLVSLAYKYLNLSASLPDGATLWNNLSDEELEAILPQAYTNNLDLLGKLPLYELLERLISIFRLDSLKGESPYCFALLDAVLEHLQKESSGLDAFLQYWDEVLAERTIPAGEVEGLRIYSIHKSKGLEFHTVLIPFCNWKLENESNGHEVWCQPEEAPYNLMDLLSISYGRQMEKSIYQKDFLKEQLELRIDNLNVLYVALTRASKNLCIYGQRSSREKQQGGNNFPTNISQLMEQSLQRLFPDYQSETPYTLGTLVPSRTQDDQAASNLLIRKPQNLSVAFETFGSKVGFRQSNRSAAFINAENETADKQATYLQQGQLLHHIFSAIDTADDVGKVLSRMVMEGVISSGQEAEKIRKLVSRALNNPQATAWFAPELLRFNERSIISRQEGEVAIRRPDRVVMTPDFKKVIVIDFKFGHPLLEYQLQVGRYMQLLQHMGYPHVEGYLWYVYKNKIEQVNPQLAFS